MNIEKFKIYYEQGLKDSEIARIENVSESTVNQIRWKLGFPPNGRKIISDYDFFELYNKGLPDTEISEISGASTSQILRRREKYHLKANPKITKTRKILNEFFVELYNQGKDDVEISKNLGVSKSAVQNYRSNYLHLPPVSKNFINIIQVQELFDQGKTDKEIGEKLGYSKEYIKQVRLKNNWYRGEKCVCADIILNDTEFQVVLGSLLGDGCITKKCSGNNAGGVLSIRHCKAQKDYIYFKQSLLKNISTVFVSHHYDDRFQNPEYIAFDLYTKSIKQLGELRDRWYTPVKTINKEDLYKINPLGLAIWYMDDGYKCKPYGGAILCTNAFSRNELEIIKEMFLDKFNIEVTTNFRSSNVIYIPSSQFPKFKILIEPYIIPSMKYKIESE